MGNSVVVGSSVAGGGRDQKKGNIDKWEEKNKKDSNQICYCAQWLIKIMDDASSPSSIPPAADENQKENLFYFTTIGMQILVILYISM